MPRDENERRRALEHAAWERSTAKQPALTPHQDSSSKQEANLVEGKVVAIASALCRVSVAGKVWLCDVRGTIHATETGFTNAVAVGDQVLVRSTGPENGVVEEVLPRRRLLSRPDVFRPHLQQIVVANADQLLIVASWREPIIWHELVDRYLVAAARNQLPSVLCVNKIDLATAREECDRELRPYRESGIPCILTSARSGEGIGELKAQIKGRISVLAGLSGVGKSSLLTAIQPTLRLRANTVSEHSGEGRHTTTQATMLAVDEQTWVVDTPDIRDFGLSGLLRSQLAGFFPEIFEAGQSCRYRNCTHHDEPGCTVREAVAEARIAPSRYHSYRLIFASLPARMG